MTVQLWGYCHSVYSWIAHAVLHEKNIEHEWLEVNPFIGDQPSEWKAVSPFNRVPVLVCGELSIYETAAITRYADEAFGPPSLQPADPLARARMNQIISIVDSYVYVPLVRRVFAHRVYRPAVNQPFDESKIGEGLSAAPRALSALEDLAQSPFLISEAPSLADFHLAPMLDYFAAAPEGAALLGQHTRLSQWLERMSTRPSLTDTRPTLPHER